MGEQRPYILIKERDENRQGILDLKLKSYFDCIPHIRALTAEHFSHVLQSDDAQEAADGRHLWVFGALVGKAGKKQRPAYVKIQLGRTLTDPVCISFHPPKHRLSFPFPSAHSTLFLQLYDEHAQPPHR